MSEELQTIEAGSLIEQALDSHVLVDGFKASSLIPELITPSVAAEVSSNPANEEKAEAVSQNVFAVSAELSQLVDTLGGVNGLKQLVSIASNADPLSMVQSLLTQEQRNILLYSIIDDPATQETLLNDADVKRAIADYYFQGNDVDEIREVVAESFQPSPDFEQRKAENAEAYKVAAQQTQLAIFCDSAKEVANRYGIDLDNPKNEVAVNAWSLQVSAFAWSNRHLIDETVKARAAGRNFIATVNTAKLANRFSAQMIELMKQLSAKPTTKVKNPPKIEASQMPSLALDDNFFASNFSKEFKKELEARGL